MRTPTNPLAFPVGMAVGPSGDVYHSGELHPDFHGMSLRDWFAGQALAGLLAEPQPEDGEPELGLGREYGTNAAKAAYRFADAMLAERSKTTGEPR